VALLAVMALLVNSRHLLMGAALVPRLEGARGRDAAAALFLMADETWALTLASERRGPAAVAYLAGLGTSLWLTWVFWTTTGALAGALVKDPERYGLDFAFIAVFLVLLRGLWRGPALLAPWLASAAVAALVHVAVPGPWYVAAGALAGIAVAALRAARRP
jgi:predicted branched-subunit amino acid permease